MDVHGIHLEGWPVGWQAAQGKHRPGLASVSLSDFMHKLYFPSLKLK